METSFIIEIAEKELINTQYDGNEKAYRDDVKALLEADQEEEIIRTNEDSDDWDFTVVKY